MTGIDDQILVHRFQDGDRKAFSILVNRYKKKAFAIAFHYVNNVDDAKELSQEAFFKAYKAMNSFKQQSNFYTWFYKILVNQCLDFKKKKRIASTPFSQFNHLDHKENFSDNIMDKTNQPADKTIISKEEMETIEVAISKLPDKQRIVFILRQFENMPLKQIALQMECKEGTVKSHLHRATMKLRELLNNKPSTNLKAI